MDNHDGTGDLSDAVGARDCPERLDLSKAKMV